MSAALRYEWVRLRTIRSTWWLSGLTFVLGVTISFLIALGFSVAFESDFPPPANTFPLLAQVVVSQASAYPSGPPFVLAYLLSIVGVFAWGHEYRHGMIRATLTSLSSRTAAWVAKFIVIGAWVGLVTLATLAVCAVAGWVWLSDDGLSFSTYDVWRTIAKCAAYTVMFTWVAMALTCVLRNQTAALVLALVWPLAIEPVILGVFLIVPGLRDHRDLTRFLPFKAGEAMLAGTDVTGSMWGNPLTPWSGFIVFAAFAAALMALSAALFKMRDA